MLNSHQDNERVFQKIVRFFGDVGAVSEAFEVTRPAAYGWAAEGFPELRAYQAHVLTDGALKASLLCPTCQIGDLIRIKPMQSDFLAPIRPPFKDPGFEYVCSSYFEGSVREMSRQLGISTPAGYNWANNGIPALRAYELHVRSNGQLIANQINAACKVGTHPKKASIQRRANGN